MSESVEVVSSFPHFPIMPDSDSGTSQVSFKLSWVFVCRETPYGYNEIAVFGFLVLK